MVNPVTIDLALERVRAFASHKGWAPSRFAVEAGLSNMALRGMHKPDWSPSAATLRKLEALIPAEFQAPRKGRAA